jgi:hypothetical protein
MPSSAKTDITVARCSRHGLRLDTAGGCPVCTSSDAKAFSLRQWGLYCLFIACLTGTVIVVIALLKPENAAARFGSKPAVPGTSPRGILWRPRQIVDDDATVPDTKFNGSPVPIVDVDVNAEDRTLGQPSLNAPVPIPTPRPPEPPRASTDPEPAAVDDPHDFELSQAPTGSRR